MPRNQPDDEHIVLLVWTTPEDYPRFVEICGRDEYPETFPEFVLMSAQRLSQLGIDPASVVRFVVDPDDMLAWCMRTHGRCDNETRAHYAGAKFRAQNGEGSETLN